MRIIPLAWWLGFLAWLESGVSGVLPCTLRATMGPVWRLLPLARPVAKALGPWLEARLAERQRQAWAGPLTEAGQAARALVATDMRVRPLTRAEVQPEVPWLRGMLVAEFARLLRVSQTPGEWLEQPGWLAWEVRCWRLVICLARLGQLYLVLEGCQGQAVAQRVWEDAARTCE